MYGNTNLHREVSQFLINNNFPPRIIGYYYIKESLVYVITSQTIPSNKELFVHLAKQFTTDIANVERCIRTLIDKVWVTLAAIGLFQARPSVRDFIFKCVEYINNNPTSRYPNPSAYDVLFD